jgi:hypothetical protein
MGLSNAYEGSCHCGQVKYKANVDLSRIISCNCSICSRRGTLLAFTPASEFTLLSGDGNLADYQFGKRSIHHLFCKTCGVSSFSKGRMPDGTEMRAINVRCLPEVDLGSLKITPYDGKSK